MTDNVERKEEVERTNAKNEEKERKEKKKSIIQRNPRNCSKKGDGEIQPVTLDTLCKYIKMNSTNKHFKTIKMERSGLST